MSGVVTAIVNSRFRDGAFWLHDKWTAWNERRFNIQTVSTADDLRDRWLSSRAGSKYNDGSGYGAPNYANIFRLAKILQPSTEDVFYEVGCGRGRVLCVMATYTLAKVVGVELVEDLCVQARLNAAQMRGRRSPVEVICGDACQVDLGGGSIYFFYHPFGPSTFREVLEKIRSTLDQSYRMIRIVYYLPHKPPAAAGSRLPRGYAPGHAVNKNILHDSGWLERYAEFTSFTGRAVVSFWRSKPDAIARPISLSGGQGPGE